MKQPDFRFSIIAAALMAALASSTVHADEDTIVVTASGFEQTVKEAPASISVITKDELENKPFRDLTDALRDIPGVMVTGGKGNTDISIRGMGSKYTLILVDGKRQSTRATRPNSDGPGIEQGWIPPLSAIERIEVIRGPMSSLYGSDAMGGVINIITRKVSKEWGGSVRLEQTFQHNSESSNPSTADLYVNGPLIDNVLGLQVFGKYATRDEDNYLTGYPEQKLGSMNGRLTYTPNADHTFRLEAGTSLQKKIATSKSASRASQHRSRRENQSISHNGQWGFATTDLSYSHENTDNYVRHMEVDNKTIDGQMLIPLPGNMLTLGGQYKKEELTDLGNQLNSQLQKLDRWSYALFMEDELRLADNFALTGGLRYDYDENYGDNWNPRGYAVWDMTDTLTLKGGVSTGFTTPIIRQSVDDWGQTTGQGSGMIYGNQNLKPEKSINYEVSLNYLNDYGVSGNITAYYTEFKDKIQSYYVCDGPSGAASCIASNGAAFDFIQSYTNVDEATLRGVEATGKLPLTESLTLSANYTWSDSEQKTGPYKGQKLNQIPKHKAGSTLDWQANDRLNLWTRVSFNGKEEKTSTTTPRTYPSYTQWDIGGSFKVEKSTTFYAGIYNIGDKKIRENNFSKTLDGRRYWVAVNIDF